MESRPVKYPFPKSIIFIISNEFCERFSNAGMQSELQPIYMNYTCFESSCLFCFCSAILMLYFTQKLMFDEHTATVFYHGSTAVVYFLCIFGAIISDSWLGKFKTIIYFSSVYALGSLIIAIGAIPTLDVSPAYVLKMPNWYGWENVNLYSNLEQGSNDSRVGFDWHWKWWYQSVRFCFRRGPV